MKINYDVVSLTAKKSGKCLCGKKLTRQKKFEQTLSPFNKDKDGNVKDRDAIYEELRETANKWKNSPVQHDHPSYWAWTDEQREDFDKEKPIRVKMSCGFEVEIRKFGWREK